MRCRHWRMRCACCIVPPDQSQRLLSDNGHPAQRRLALEELLAHQLSLRCCGSVSAGAGARA